jgi:hypothetical protein
MYSYLDDDSAYKVLSQLLSALKYLHEDVRRCWHHVDVLS